MNPGRAIGVHAGLVRIGLHLERVTAGTRTSWPHAESDEETARSVNALGPRILAEAAASRKIPIIHLSTDYVFDGSGDTARAEDAPTAPLGVYGQTKLDGERAVQAAAGQYAIMRSSWVFSAHGNNFVKTMLRFGAERDRLTIVADQIGGPTASADIAAAALSMAATMRADATKGGIYHFAGAPDVSWADFAREIFAQSDLAPEVVDIPSSDYPTPAKRPLNSRLHCAAISHDFGIARPDWRVSLQDVIKELSA